MTTDHITLRDLNKLQEGIGEKIGMLFFLVSTFVLSILMAFHYGWQLTLLLLSMIPMMGLATFFLSKVQVSFVFIVRCPAFLRTATPNV